MVKRMDKTLIQNAEHDIDDQNGDHQQLGLNWRVGLLEGVGGALEGALDGLGHVDGGGGLLDTGDRVAERINPGPCRRTPVTAGNWPA